MAEAKLKVAASTEIKIDKNFVSTGRTGRGRNGRYPFNEMEVGDSFQVPTDVAATTAYGIARDANVSATLAQNGKRFSVKKQADGTYRCWRIA